MERKVLPDKTHLALAAVTHITAQAETAIQRDGRFSLALSGGSTPLMVYVMLTKVRLDWDRVHLFWGDERCVPPDHADSNYHMARQNLLDHIDIPPTNVYRIQGELPPLQAAQDYENALRAFFPGPQTFDLILLGMGDDGHTASLFPGTPALTARKRWVAAVKHDRPPHPLVDRVSLTLPAINAARQVTFLVSGESKAARLKEVFAANRASLPVNSVQPTSGGLLWLIDQPVAGLDS